MNEQHEHDATPGQAPESPDTDAALLAELETLRNELDQLRATTLLERADLENQRKRVARDIEQARKFANERLLGDLLPVFDSLDAGLAAAGSELLIGFIGPFGPLAALIILYGVTLVATEFLSNAAVAVLVTPIAVALAENLGVDPRPFLVAVMMAASAAFATPFGYQTNVLVFQMGGYSYMDFVRVGVPLNIVTWIAAMIAIPVFFPF